MGIKENINNEPAKIIFCTEQDFFTYTGKEIKTEAKENAGSIVMNNFFEEKPLFGQIKECFLRFKKLSQTSTLFGTEGFLGAFDGPRDQIVANGFPSFYKFEALASLKLIEDDAEIEVFKLQDLCFTTFTYSGTRESQPINSSCGTYLQIGNNVTYESTLSVPRQLESAQNFFGKIQDAVNRTITTEDTTFRPFEFKDREVHNFFFFVNYQRKRGTFISKVAFWEGHILGKNMNFDYSALSGAEDVPVSIQSSLVLTMNTGLELFGHKIVSEEPTPAPTPPNPDTNTPNGNKKKD